MIDVGLIVARLLHYAATTILAGLSFFPLYAYAHAEPKSLVRWRRRVLLWSAVAALISGLFWFAFSAANMSGSLADLADPMVAWSIAHDTGFGLVWAARMLLGLVIVGVAVMQRFSTATVSYDRITSLLTAALLGSLAGTGHSQVEEGWASLVHVTSDAAHLLAAGAWLGGLVPLGHMLMLSSSKKGFAQKSQMNGVLLRFSSMGYLAVATLIGSGLINGWFLIGSVSGLFTTPYGRVLLVKLALFVGMLALAVSNRLWLVPSMTEVEGDDRSGSTAWSGKLRNHVLGEQCLGVAVLLVVSVLGTMRPAIAQ